MRNANAGRTHPLGGSKAIDAQHQIRLFDIEPVDWNPESISFRKPSVSIQESFSSIPPRFNLLSQSQYAGHDIGSGVLTKSGLGQTRRRAVPPVRRGGLA